MKKKSLKSTFIIFLILTVIDLFIPDPIPFLDEIILIIIDVVLYSKMKK